MARPAGLPIGPNEDIALGAGVLSTIEKHVRVMEVRSTERAKRLMQCMSFYEGKHHDHLSRRWDGTARDPGVGYLHERMKPQGFVPSQSVPYGQRKPDTSMPLVRQIVNRFSEMLLGEGRQPSIFVPADLGTERYLQTIFNEAMCWDVLMEARDVAGSCGAVAILPAVKNGAPTAEVLMPYDCHVARWKNGANWEPLEVIEQRLVERVVPDEEANTGKLVTKKYWRTRMWTETHTIHFDDVPENWEAEEPIPCKKENKVEHKAGRCPVIWYQNTRNTKSPDGMPDCAGVWHLIDQLDRIMSQIYRAARANVDPTLLVKEEERYKRKIGEIRKGGLITTSAQGDARYLEMSGDSVKSGMEVANLLRQEILQTAECIIVDPSSAGAYKSGEALQLLWRAMEAKANRLRVMLSQAMREMIRIWLHMGKEFGVANIEDENPGEGILLPPVVELPDLPEDPGEIARNDAIIKAQEVGTGSHVEFRWPPYWNPTASQVDAMAKGLTTAGSLLSQETRTAEMAKILGLDPQEEVNRLAKERMIKAKQDEDEFEAEMEKLRSEELDRLGAEKEEEGDEVLLPLNKVEAPNKQRSGPRKTKNKPPSEGIAGHEGEQNGEG